MMTINDYDKKQIVERIFNEFSLINLNSKIKNILTEYQKKWYLSHIINTFDIDLKPIVTYTTRPRRDDEIDGRDHIFITQEKRNAYFNSGTNILAYTKIGEYEYFTMEPLNGANIYIIDPKGVKSLYNSKSKDFDTRTIYIYLDEENRRKRCSERSDFNEKFEKRNKDENDQFCSFEDSKLYNIKIDNYDLQKSISQFIYYIIKETILSKKDILFLVVGRTGAGKDSIVSESAKFIQELQVI